ncbi:TPA: DUF4474 domain-containing protein [Klebsiella pneumoniae]|nr:DUF4474 domain-containing protein [Klebsiella pneumoniae]HBV1828910.1 DUF4474 domain-containing protein [Klebsiella pneumoniae]
MGHFVQCWFRGRNFYRKFWKGTYCVGTNCSIGIYSAKILPSQT